MSSLYVQITKFIGMLATGARGTVLPCLPFLFKLCWPFHQLLSSLVLQSAPSLCAWRAGHLIHAAYLFLLHLPHAHLQSHCRWPA